MTTGVCSTCGLEFDSMTEPCESDACGFGNVDTEAMNPHKILDFHLDDNRIDEIQPEDDDNEY